ncbi:glycerate kinase, partial [Streptomyces lavendulocolor]|uniref:glycerate kinase n=1 Tax=Streptomyces lavendulocolor TaxID=67316 RepID=UPI0033F9CD6C
MSPSYRIVVAPGGFKESLSAREAAEAIAEGLLRVLPDAELDLVPLVDGGEARHSPPTWMVCWSDTSRLPSVPDTRHRRWSAT